MGIKEELDQHLLISQRNSNTIQQKQKEILSGATLFKENVSNYQKVFAQCSAVTQCIEIHKQTQEQKLMLHSINKEISKKEKCVKLLNQRSQKLNTRLQELKNVQQEKSDYSEMKMLKKALHKFTSVFQYIIDTVSCDESSSYHIAIKFIFDGNVSQYPIGFTIDRETDKITGINASNLLSSIQLDKLLDRFNQTNNNVALLCTLRKAVLMKHLS